MASTTLDVLALGPYVFTDFGIPAALPGGGSQQIKIHKLPGGDRTVDTMGPDDDDRSFDFTIFSGDATTQILTLDAMRAAGQALPYSNGVEARVVIIAKFVWHLERYNVAHCSIILTPIDNPNGTSGSAGPVSADTLVGSDLGSASTASSTNIASQGGVTTPTGSIVNQAGINTGTGHA